MMQGSLRWLLVSVALLLVASGCATGPDADGDGGVSRDEAAEQGAQAWRDGDYQRAMRLLQQAAVAGDARAQYAVGYMYYAGQGVERDRDRAMPWLRRAAEQGDPRAIEALGRLASGIRRGNVAPGGGDKTGAGRDGEGAEAPSTGDSPSADGADGGASPARSSSSPPADKGARDSDSSAGAGSPAPSAGASQTMADTDTDTQQTAAEPSSPARAGAASADGTAGSAASVGGGSEAAPAVGGADAGWFAKRADERFTIQLIGAYRSATVDRFLDDLTGADVRPRRLVTRHDGRDWHVVVAGDYPGRRQARRAIDQLPADWRRNGAFARSFGSLRP